MVKEMKIEIISRETIKPSSPTPQNLKIFKLSFLDQLASPVYVPVLLIYSINGDHTTHLDFATKSQRLKISLSEILTQFYPLAGRVKDNSIIECNDEGVEFFEAQIHCSLSAILENFDPDSAHQLLPTEVGSQEAGTGPLLLVQANLFECGGLAIAICISHKIADASTIGSFIKGWSATASGSIAEEMLPKYVLGSLYPKVDFPVVIPSAALKMSKCITKRFVFAGSKLAELKAKVGSKMVEHPTRVEAVSALLWKCAATASRTNRKSTTRPTIMGQLVNIRKRVSPALPENSVGNFVGHFLAGPETGSEPELKHLVIQLRKRLEEFSKIHVPKLQDENAFLTICEAMKDCFEIAYNDDNDFYGCSSWCSFSFYEADFGWERPKWVSVASSIYKNSILLLDTSDGKGIESWVTLSEQDMALVESNQELLEFATLNPRIL